MLHGNLARRGKQHGDQEETGVFHSDKARTGMLHGNLARRGKQHGDQEETGVFHSDKARTDMLHGNLARRGMQHGDQEETGVFHSDTARTGMLHDDQASTSALHGMGLGDHLVTIRYLSTHGDPRSARWTHVAQATGLPHIRWLLGVGQCRAPIVDDMPGS